MIGEGLERRDKGKGVARPKKRQRQTPKYVLRVPATLPTTAAPSPSSVVPSPTPAVHPPPTFAVHPPPTPVVDILPPLVIITLTAPPVIITPIAPPDPTSIPSSSCISPSKTATPSVDPDSPGDGDGVDSPLHDRPWIQPYGKGFIPST
ncbi:classical arabinogalactan protein 9-like, partial [Vigna umbellata]|uniref:classical arabinogalactan protein 9-like n=1 Tax=Vigna umbellata TaxID=87088 RepID=UPI001F5E686D